MANVQVVTYRTDRGDYGPDTLLKSGPCSCCLDQKEQWAVLALLMYIIAKQTTPTSVNDILEDSGCFKCYNEHELMAILINAVAQYAINNDYVELGDLRQMSACLNCTDIKTLQAAVLEWFAVFLASVTPA